MSAKEEQSETEDTNKRKRDGYPSCQDKKEQKQIKLNEGDNNSIEKVMKNASCPIFLKKTYGMVNTCDQEIVRWSSDGSYFIITNPMRFTTDIIPRYFKHNNLQSFARQLNLYGFRKIKTDAENAESSDENKAKYLCFRHKQFIRDRPDLLFKIRKPSSKGPSVQQEIDSLKSEVIDLNGIVSKMANRIESLDSLLRKSSVLGDLDAKIKSNESTDNVSHGQNIASHSATNQIYTSEYCTNEASFSDAAVNKNHMLNMEYIENKKVASVAERLQIPQSANCSNSVSDISNQIFSSRKCSPSISNVGYNTHDKTKLKKIVPKNDKISYSESSGMTQSPLNINIPETSLDQISSPYGFPYTKESMNMSSDDLETVNTDVFSVGTDEAEDESNQFI